MKEIEEMSAGEESVLVSLQLQSLSDLGTIVLRGEMFVVDDPEKDVSASFTDRRKLIGQLKEIQKWEKKHFPHWTPRICLELFKLLGEGKPDSKPYTVKEIVLATGFSERAVRTQLSRFENNNWIERKKNHLDRRNSHIQPRDELRVVYMEWLRLHLKL